MAKREKEQMDKQRSTKHTHKTKDRVSSSCSTNGTSCVNLVTYPVNELKANTSILVECILTFFSVYKAWFNFSGAKNHHSYIMNIFVPIFVWAVMRGCYNIYIYIQ
jgi:hypothetical protein